MEINVERTLKAHEAQLNNLKEVIRDLNVEVRRIKRYADESEYACSNTDVLAEELDSAVEALKKQSALIDLLLLGKDELKEDMYILKQKVSANEQDISYLETVIEDNI